jgi:hypothetical protein
MLKSFTYRLPSVLCSASNTSFTGTPSEIACSRFTSTRSCGDVGRKKVLMPCSCGSAESASMKVRSTCPSWAGSDWARDCR